MLMDLQSMYLPKKDPTLTHKWNKCNKYINIQYDK